MRLIVSLVVIVFMVVVPAHAMLTLPMDMYKKVGSYLDATSFLRVPQVCAATKKVWDGFSSKDLEENGISLHEAFEQGNAHILARFIKEKNYRELIDNDRFARSVILWAAQNGHRAIFDDLRHNDKIIKGMGKRTSYEVKVWELLNKCKDDCAKRAENNSNIDLHKEFVNDGLLIAVKHSVPSIVHMFIHTRSYFLLIEAQSMRKALLMAVQNSSENIVKILLSNARVVKLVGKDSACKAITLACENDAEQILEHLLYNRCIWDLVSAGWLNKLSNEFCDDYIGHFIEECRLSKLDEIRGQ